MALDLIEQELTIDNIPQICGGVSLAIGATVSIAKIIEMWRQRRLLTLVLERVNNKVNESRFVAKRDRNQRSNELHLSITYLTIIQLTLTLAFSLFMTLYSLITGEFYFTMALPWQRISYSFSWWCEFFYIEIHLLFYSLFFPLIEGILIDTALQIPHLFRVQHDTLLSLSANDPNCDKKIIAVASELLVLTELSEDYLKVCKNFHIYLNFIGNIIIALGAIGVLLDLKNGTVAVFTMLFYPAYVITVIGVWCFAGSYYNDEVCIMMAI